jgi:glycosyltransferase involved in cell wall biosynthesis
MAMAQRLIYFTDSDSFGGAEQVILNTLGQLDRRCWQPTLVHYPAAGLAPLLQGVSRLDLRVRALARPDRPAARVAQFARLLRAERPANVHAHLSWPLACRYELVGAIMAGVPAIIATQHLFSDVPWRRSRLVQRLICTRVDRYIAVSHHLARQLHERLRFPAHKVRVIHNGIPFERFRRVVDPDLRAALAGSSERALIMTVARLAEQKGQCFLLAALRALPNAIVALVGDGPDRAQLERQAQDLGLRDRVVFLGQRADIPELLACCDVAVLPSLFEGLPLAALEAMAAGKPVVATRVGGTSEVIQDGVTGLLAAPADPDALAQAIGAVLSSPAHARSLGAAAQARVARSFSVEVMTEQVTNLYDQVLAANHG